MMLEDSAKLPTEINASTAENSDLTCQVASILPQCILQSLP